MGLTSTLHCRKVRCTTSGASLHLKESMPLLRERMSAEALPMGSAGALLVICRGRAVGEEAPREAAAATLAAAD